MRQRKYSEWRGVKLGPKVYAADFSSAATVLPHEAEHNPWELPRSPFVTTPNPVLAPLNSSRGRAAALFAESRNDGHAERVISEREALLFKAGAAFFIVLSVFLAGIISASLAGF